MTEIPPQLQDPAFRFIIIPKGQKRPTETDWQRTANYSFDDPKLKEHLVAGGNYGVVGGFGNIVIIDADSQQVKQAVGSSLPETFTVKTGRGGLHFYYRCPTLDTPIRLREEGGKAGSIGDVQWSGKQVVGPNSLHTNGNIYVVEKSLPIQSITAEALRLTLKDFIQSSNAGAIDDEKTIMKSNVGLAINITMEQVVKSDILKTLQPQSSSKPRELQGAHPIHGSDTGMNFSVNLDTNEWHCFRCDSGGGPFSWVAVAEGIIPCDQARRGVLRGEKFWQTREVCINKYGIQIPLPGADSDKYYDIITDPTGKVLSKTFVPGKLADDVQSQYHFKTVRDNSTIFFYHLGVYRPEGENIIREAVRWKLDKKLKIHYAQEVVYYIQTGTYTSREEMDKNLNLLCLENGLLDTNTLELLPFNPTEFITVKLPIKYLPAASCPDFLKFLSEVLQPQDIAPMQEFFGYCLYRKYPIHRAFMLIGEGSNGKSTLLNILERFLGKSNISRISLQDLDSNRFAKAKLFCKLANLYTELTPEAVKRTGTFKGLTGEDTIGADVKFKEGFDFDSYAKLIFSCNRVPETEDDSLAYYRRWTLLEFPNTFPPEKAIASLAEKISTPEELSGILNWALEGLKRLLAQGNFTGSESAETVRDRYNRLANSLNDFIAECVDRSKYGSYISITDFYAAYVKHCQKSKLYIKSKFQVGKEMPSHGITETTKNINGISTRVWQGIEVIDHVG